MANKRNDRKNIRRDEAVERQERWNSLTAEEKLKQVRARLDARDDTDEDSILYTKEHRKLRLSVND